MFSPEKEKLLQQLGSNESTGLLLLSAALTCVVAPICEEMLFRAYMFTALRNWRGTLPAALITGVLFGGVHAGSAPVLDLVPLAALGFGLCLLYRFTGSIYPSITAHSINNSIAFSSLEGWGWQTPLLLVCALLTIGALVDGLPADRDNRTTGPPRPPGRVGLRAMRITRLAAVALAASAAALAAPAAALAESTAPAPQSPPAATAPPGGGQDVGQAREQGGQPPVRDSGRKDVRPRAA